jgi:hypothetical protein
MATRNETLMIARQATANAPVATVTYTDRELEQRDAYREAIRELRAVAEVWRVENERAVTRRKQLAREAVAVAYLRAKARKLETVDEIVTSAPAVQAPTRKVSPFADTVILPFKQPFPLCRPVLRGKVRPAPKPGRVSAIGNFFKCVAVFVNG